MSKLTDFVVFLAATAYLSDRHEARKEAKKRAELMRPAEEPPKDTDASEGILVFGIMGVLALLVGGFLSLFTETLFLVALAVSGVMFFLCLIAYVCRASNNYFERKSREKYYFPKE